MNKPTVHFKSHGQSGNIYWILAAVRKVLQKQSRITDFNNMWERVQNSGSYTEALAIIREYVDLIDDDGRF